MLTSLPNRPVQQAGESSQVFVHKNLINVLLKSGTFHDVPPTMLSEFVLRTLPSRQLVFVQCNKNTKMGFWTYLSQGESIMLTANLLTCRNSIPGESFVFPTRGKENETRFLSRAWDFDTQQQREGNREAKRDVKEGVWEGGKGEK